MEHTEAEIDSVISRQNVSKEGWTTYYVDGTDGNDGNNGLRWETAFKTIQHAIDTAESWATIYIKAGSYPENVIINKEGIRCIGEKKETTIINPPTGNAVHLAANNSTISHISAESGTATNPKAILIDSSDFCEVFDVIVKGTGVGVQVETGTAAPKFTKISYVSATDSSLEYGIMVAGHSKYIHIENCIIENISDSGIRLTTYSSNVEVSLCFISHCWRSIILSNCTTHNTIYHNIFLSPVYEQLRNGSDSPLTSFFFENFYDDHTTDTNNDGLCDTPYTFIGGVDYAPVSKRNGWKQVSLGMTPSSSIIIANTFSLVNALLTLTETGGTITTDGTVQTVYINNAPAGVFQPRKLLIDFTNHVAGDVMIIRTYYRLKSGGGLIKQDEEPIVDVQDPATITIDLEENRFGYEVTIEKTVGANLTYDWEVLYKA